MTLATDIHSPEQLVERAGQNAWIQATLMPFHKKLLIISSDTDSSVILQLNNWPRAVKDLYSERWMSTDPNARQHALGLAAASNNEFPSPEPCNIPRLCLSPGLKGPDFMDENGESMLEYLAVIQGKSGNASIKYIIRTSISALATSIMQEALNGYSIVFTGALLRHAEIYDNFVWVQADSFDSLVSIHERDVANTAKRARKNVQGSHTVGIWCINPKIRVMVPRMTLPQH